MSLLASLDCLVCGQANGLTVTAHSLDMLIECSFCDSEWWAVDDEELRRQVNFEKKEVFLFEEEEKEI